MWDSLIRAKSLIFQKRICGVFPTLDRLREKINNRRYDENSEIPTGRLQREPLQGKPLRLGCRDICSVSKTFLIHVKRIFFILWIKQERLRQSRAQRGEGRRRQGEGQAWWKKRRDQTEITQRMREKSKTMVRRWWTAEEQQKQTNKQTPPKKKENSTHPNLQTQVSFVKNTLCSKQAACLAGTEQPMCVCVCMESLLHTWSYKYTQVHTWKHTHIIEAWVNRSDLKGALSCSFIGQWITRLCANSQVCIKELF